MTRKFSIPKQRELKLQGLRGCNSCGEIQNIENFNPDSSGGLKGKCKYCLHLYEQKYHNRKPLSKDDFYHKISTNDRAERMHIKKIVRVHNVDFSTALELRATKVCEICRKTEDDNGRRLAVDHCHITGKVRGILCNGCNRGIGYLGDDVERLENAIKYLKKS
jgi:hypothetical protein